MAAKRHIKVFTIQDHNLKRAFKALAGRLGMKECKLGEEAIRMLLAKHEPVIPGTKTCANN